MPNLLKVHAADESASEQATETRAKIQEWADKYLPDVPAPVIVPLEASAIKQMRVMGAASVLSTAAWYAEQEQWKPQSQFAALLISMAGGTRQLIADFPKDEQARELSYAFEGAVREFHKQFFKAGMQWNTQAELLASMCFQVPFRTSAYADHMFNKQCGTYNWIISRNPRYTHSDYSRKDGGYYPDELAQGIASRERFAGIKDWVFQAAFTDRELKSMGENDQTYWMQTITGLCSVLLFNYMEADGPWVAGFLTTDDAAHLKFTRVRLGAFLATQGNDDTWVRSLVERAKQTVAQASFEMYPNDVLWQTPYRAGVDSCMASEPSHYNVWDEHHPTDAYCSSYFGNGDNSLALLVSKDGTGSVDGRGIVNLQKGSIVRWYGSTIAERVLKRNGVDTDDDYALKNSWLALIQQDNQFIHPYNDGRYAFGKMDLEAGRVYFVDDDDCVCLQDTSGSSYMIERKYCVDVGEERPEEEANWQDFHQNYVTSDATDEWACAVTGEYCMPGDRHTMEIYGVEVEVSDYFTMSRYQRSHLMQLPNGGWGILDDAMREEFISQHDIEEDVDDEDEEAA